MKFTAIYRVSFPVGSHYQTIIEMRRFELQEGEDVSAALTREGIYDDVEFVFVGHPLMEGEAEIAITPPAQPLC